MTAPYTIKLFVPSGEPENLKVITKMNWTGIGLEVSRRAWNNHRSMEEFSCTGIYILFGYKDESDLPTLYIGQTNDIRKRINEHEEKIDFWDKAIVFVSSNGGLNRAHITWLEWALLSRAKQANRCTVANTVMPSEPVLTESEKADTNVFLSEILSILPLIEIRLFEVSEKMYVPHTANDNNERSVQNTLVVPAREDGFNQVFLGEDCWHAIHIGGGKLNDIKYIAAYQSAPISAVTHYAEVESIEPYGEGRKYKLNFVAPAMKIGPIPFGQAKRGTMRGPQYTSYAKLTSAKEIVDLFS